MSLHLALIIAYAAAITGLGLWTARYVRTSGDFFVAGRGLGAGLIFSSMLAANIGAGATIGVTGIAYRDGLSAWWWSGSAGLGSLLLAFWIGPRLWRLANAHGFYTTGDFLEHRYGASVRVTVAVLIALISLVILAAQLIAGATIVSTITGAPRWVGAIVGGAVMTIYFAAGGLLGTAWVNTLQLVVMLIGFIAALPFAVGAAGGLGALTMPPAPEWFGDPFYSSGPGSGWTFLFLTGPAFVISPGLIQKAYGAKSERALTLGVAANALALMVFTLIPVLLGMSAHVLLPGLAGDAVLPTLFLQVLPPWLGALALAAVFSTAVDTCDGILFMLSTSVAKDIYGRHLNRTASDAQLLKAARVIAVAGGIAGVVLSIYLSTVVTALRVFYSVLGVSMFVPVLGGLFSRRAGAREALASIVVGIATLAVVGLGPRPYPWLDPTLTGLTASALAFGVVLFVGQKVKGQRQR